MAKSLYGTLTSAKVVDALLALAGALEEQDFSLKSMTLEGDRVTKNWKLFGINIDCEQRQLVGEYIL